MLQQSQRFLEWKQGRILVFNDVCEAGLAIEASSFWCSPLLLGGIAELLFVLFYS